MARCGECIHFKCCEPWVSQDESFPEVDGCNLFKDKNDFVPRAEVEKAKREADRLAVELEAALAENERLKAENTKLNGDVEIWKQNRFNIFQTVELYRKTREKVAREIFEEIEMLMKKHIFPVVREGAIEIEREPFLIIDPQDWAVLKSRYTFDGSSWASSPTGASEEDSAE